MSAVCWQFDAGAEAQIGENVKLSAILQYKDNAKARASRRLLLLLLPASLLHIVLFLSMERNWSAPKPVSQLPVIHATLSLATMPLPAQATTTSPVPSPPGRTANPELKPKSNPKPKPKPKLKTRVAPKPPVKQNPVVKQSMPETEAEVVPAPKTAPSNVVQKEIHEPVIDPKPASIETAAVIDSFTPPRGVGKRLKNPPPLYPRTSRRLGEEGTVIVRLLVRADGSVTDWSIKQSSTYPRLDRSAIKAVKRWRYRPAMRNGKAVDAWHEQSIVFALRTIK